MKKYMVIYLFIGLVCTTTSNARWGNDFEWDPISPADWEVKQDKNKGITHGVVLFSKTIADDTHPNQIIHSIYRRIRILSEEGRKYGDVIVPIMVPKQIVNRIYGRTILQDGRILELEHNQIVEKVEVKTKGFMVKRNSFSMPGVTDNCIIEYYIELYLPSLAQKIWFFQEDNFLLHGELQWHLFRGEFMTNADYNKYFTPNWNLYPANMEIDVQRLPSAEFVSETRITVKDIAPFDPEPYSLPERSIRGQLNFYYGPKIGPAAYWKEENKKQTKSLEDFCKKNKLVRKIAEEIVQLKTDEDKIQAAYNWVQKNIENISYKPKDDKEKHKKNKNANQVLKRGYGTHLDINIVFYDILREMNINARIGAVVDRDEHFFNPNAKYWQFEGSVVIVPSTQHGDRFYSPGEKYLPCGFLPWYNEGVRAFVIGDPNRQFMVLPFSTSSFNSKQRIINLSLDSGFKLNGKGIEAHSGHYGRRIRVLTSRIDSAVYQEEIRKRLASEYANAKIESITLDKVEEQTSPVEVTYTIAFSDGGQKVGSKLLILPFKYMAESNNPFLAENRKTPILFDFASQSNDSLNLILPENWEVEALPSRARLQNEAGLCEVVFSVNGKTISVKREFRVNKAFLPMNYYQPVKELFQFRKELEKTTIILNEKA